MSFKHSFGRVLQCLGSRWIKIPRVFVIALRNFERNSISSLKASSGGEGSGRLVTSVIVPSVRISKERDFKGWAVVVRRPLDTLLYALLSHLVQIILHNIFYVP